MNLFLEKMNIDHQRLPFNYRSVMEIDLEGIGTVSSVKDLNMIPYRMLRSFMYSLIDKPTIPEIELQQSASSGGANFIEYKKGYIHPMDVFIYIFLNCDPLFRQIFVNQISKYHLSLPLVIPQTELCKPTIFSFTYRSLIRSYYSADTQEIIEFYVSDARFNVVSFIRFGGCQKMEKSKLLNSLLGYNKPSFFDENSENCCVKRLLFNGTIEMNWFLPDELDVENALHSKPITFLNLRGNAFEFSEQVKFLFEMSSMVGIMVRYCEMKNNEFEGLRKLIDDYPENICFIIEGENVEDVKNMLNIDSNNIVIHLASKFDQMEISIRKRIQQFVSKNSSKIRSIMDFSTLANAKGIKLINEQDVHSKIPEYENSINQFKESILTKTSKSSFFQDCLPLQVEWEKYVEVDKNQCQNKQQGFMGAVTVVKGYFDKFFQLTVQRNIQREKLYFQLNQTAIGKMIHLKLYNFKDASYMLTLLRIELEKLILNSELHSHVVETVNEQVSVGVRHFLRELGQFYEIHQQWDNKIQSEAISKLTKISYRILPSLFAKLLFLGHPFEILDGDVQHMPFEWVRAVLNCLQHEICGSKKIFVLGVLGIQSSGKSTLLNTMFGLQFPVAPGRCTRGVSMQIISMEHSLASNLKYDYMVIVDSEGLRSVDLSDDERITRDNELATFVVGISDLTLINIKGENYNDWENIFQIIILALTKLCSCDSKPKCYFIHQNVQPNAKQKLKNSYRQFLNRLDEATCLISSEMNSNHKFKRFTDIIDFDINSSIFYFTSLFATPLPRSEISPHYRKSALDLMTKIVKSYSGESNPYPFSTLHAWNKKIKTVWTCILKENFVFSYKSLREHACYVEFENALNQWSQNYSYEIEQNLLLLSEEIYTLEYKEAEKIIEKYQTQITKVCNMCLKDMEKEIKEIYFADHKERKIFLQWETRAEAHFCNIRLNHELIMKKRLIEILQIAEQNEHIIARFKSKRKQIIERAKRAELEKFLESFEKNEKSQDFVENFFETEWEKWIDGIEFSIEDHNAYIDLQKAINDLTIMLYASGIEKAKIRTYFEFLNKYKIVSRDKFIICSSHYRKGKQKNTYSYSKFSHNNIDNNFFCWIDFIQQVDSIDTFDEDSWNSKNEIILKVNKLRQKICDTCKTFTESAITKQYTPTVYTNIISTISLHVDEFNSCLELSSDNKKIHIENMFIYELLLFICTDIMNKFMDLRKTNQMDILKAQLKSNFTNFYNKEHYSLTMACANGVATILVEKMNYYLADTLQLLLWHNFSTSIEHSIYSKCHLQVKVLIGLTEEDSFDKYLEYIEHPNKIMKEWIDRKFRLFCRSEHMLDNYKVGIESCLSIYKQALQKALRQDEGSNNKAEGSLQDNINPNWKFKLHQLLANDHTRQFKLSDLEVILIDPRTIKDPEQFIHFFNESFIYKINLINFEDWFQRYVIGNISSEVIGRNFFHCDVVCPLCNEPCLSSDNSADHVHNCGSFHRPLCINGWFKSDTGNFIRYDCSNIKNNTTLVQHNTLQYKECFEASKGWDNCVRHYMIESDYWGWVMHKYSYEFTKHYGYGRNEKALKEWSQWSKKQVLNLMHEQMNDFLSPELMWRAKKTMKYYLTLKFFYTN